MMVPFYVAVLFGAVTAIMGYLAGSANPGRVRFRKKAGEIEIEVEATNCFQLAKVLNMAQRTREKED
jgi:hypothetical protein